MRSLIGAAVVACLMAGFAYPLLRDDQSRAAFAYLLHPLPIVHYPSVR